MPSRAIMVDRTDSNIVILHATMGTPVEFTSFEVGCILLQPITRTTCLCCLRELLSNTSQINFNLTMDPYISCWNRSEIRNIVQVSKQ